MVGKRMKTRAPIAVMETRTRFALIDSLGNPMVTRRGDLMIFNIEELAAEYRDFDGCAEGDPLYRIARVEIREIPATRRGKNP